MSTSSGLGGSSNDTVRGSSAIPQIGHAPGTSLTISGCIGHVKLAPSGTGAAGASPAFRNEFGSALKRSRQLGLQK